MKQILSSATKITLISIVFTLCVCVLALVLLNIHSDSIIGPFISLFAGASFTIIGYYFGKKEGKENTDSVPPVTP